MSRVIATYDLDEDHARLWVNADLEAMPEIVIVKNIRGGKEQTSTFTRPSGDADNTRELLADTAKLRLAGDAE